MKRLSLSLALVGLLAAGCGEDEKPAPRPGAQGGGEASGPGFTTEKPEGFTGGGGREGRVGLTLLGPLEGGGFPPNITVGRSPAPPNASVEQLRSSIRSQSEAQGGRDVEELSDREIDDEPAIGVTYSRTAPQAKLTQRTYAVVHRGSLYTIAATTPEKSTVDGEKALETVLDAWSWVK